MAGVQINLVALNRHVDVCLSTGVHKHEQTSGAGHRCQGRVFVRMCLYVFMCPVLSILSVPSCRPGLFLSRKVHLPNTSFEI